MKPKMDTEFTIHNLEIGIVVHTRKNGNYMVNKSTTFSEVHSMNLDRCDDNLKIINGNTAFDITKVTASDPGAYLQRCIERCEICYLETQRREISEKKALRVLSDYYECNVTIVHDENKHQ